jgi:hypothetical protein
MIQRHSEFPCKTAKGVIGIYSRWEMMIILFNMAVLNRTSDFRTISQVDTNPSTTLLIIDSQLTDLVEVLARKLDDDLELTTSMGSSIIWPASPLDKSPISPPSTPIPSTPTTPAKDDIADFRTANHELTRIVNLIVVTAATRAGKQKLKLRRQDSGRTIFDSREATSPSTHNDTESLESVFERAKVLKRILMTHWEYVVPKRPVVPKDKLSRNSIIADYRVTKRQVPAIPVPWGPNPLAGLYFKKVTDE